MFFIILWNFNKIPWTVLELCPGQENLIKGNNKKVSKAELWFLYTALPFNVFYPFIQQNLLNSFGIIPWARKFNKGK